jgi:hypothetical protein
VADVIEENLLAERQLTIGFGFLGAHHQLFVPVIGSPAVVSRTILARLLHATVRLASRLPTTYRGGRLVEQGPGQRELSNEE